MRFLPLSLLLSCILLLQSPSSSAATIIPLGSTLSPTNTTSWTSPNKTFTLSFIPAPRNPSAYLAAITYSTIPVWSAGGADSIVDFAASLSLTLTGNLVLLNGSGFVVWQSGTANKGVTSASLDDTGNLRLTNGSFTIWQSFDNPTDTILQAQDLTYGKSLRSGLYSFTLLKTGNLTLKWNGSVLYYNKGLSFSNTSLVSPVLTLQTNGIVSLLDSSLANPAVVSYSSNYGEGGDMMRFLRLDSDGNLRAYSVYNRSGNPNVQWSAVEDQCEVFAWCGNMGVCSYTATSPICVCPPLNFMPVDVNDTTKGCKRRIELQDCPGNATMLELAHTQFLTYPPEISTEQFFVGITACRLNCLSGASCVASTALSDGSGLCNLKVSNFLSGYRSTALPSTSFVKVCAPVLPNV